MPERIFKYKTVDELIALAGSLANALTTGSTTDLRNNHTGFLKSTGELTTAELRNAIRDVRFEIYTRGLAGGDSADAVRCAVLEPTNPLHEKVMRVETSYAPPYFLTSPYGA